MSWRGHRDLASHGKGLLRALLTGGKTEGEMTCKPVPAQTLMEALYPTYEPRVLVSCSVPLADEDHDYRLGFAGGYWFVGERSGLPYSATYFEPRRAPEVAAKLRLRLDDEETRRIWATVERAAAEVAAWPAWKRGER